MFISKLSVLCWRCPSSKFPCCTKLDSPFLTVFVTRWMRGGQFSSRCVSPCPWCSLTRAPGNPPPVLANPIPSVPLLGRSVVVPESRPLSAPVTEDSELITIPAPPHCAAPSGFLALRVRRGRRFHCLAGGHRRGSWPRRPIAFFSQNSLARNLKTPLPN